jgi:RNA polymerase sigma-70 factor (ECF subfamily)
MPVPFVSAMKQKLPVVHFRKEVVAVPDTSASLLQRLQAQPDGPSWQQLVELYQPLLYAWLRRHALQTSDADDIVQDVLATLVRELPQFHYDSSRGCFRGWLRTILVNRLRGFWRKRQNQALAGNSDVAELLDQLEDPHSDLSRRFDVEHDRFIAGRLLERLQPDFEEKTWQAFQRVVFEGKPPRTVAAELGVTVNAVFVAKSRVLQRLRQEMRGLTD